MKSTYNDEDINNLNRLVDSLVHNNSGLFALNPAFIIRYTNYFILSPFQDYTKGEAVFSKIFEFELQQSIIKLAHKEDVDEIFVAFEEIAGHMYLNRHDVLQIDELKQIIPLTAKNFYFFQPQLKSYTRRCPKCWTVTTPAQQYKNLHWGKQKSGRISCCRK